MDRQSEAFCADLRSRVRGEVLVDEVSRLIYSTDASLYQLTPAAVFLPLDSEDVLSGIEVACRHSMPILARGGGTSLAGQTVTNGLVIDLSKHMDQILEVNTEERWVRVQPGVILDNLNDFLRPYSLFFAPDVATSSRANLGGMIGNNSSGMRSVRYGKTVDHILEMNVILSTRDRLHLRALNPTECESICRQTNHEGEIYRKIRELVQANGELIRARFPKVMRRVSGYNLDELVDFEVFNLSKLFVGSEGTLGIVTEAKFKLEPIPVSRALAVLHFNDLLDAIRTVPILLEYQPSAVEVLDRYALELARSNPAVSSLCEKFLHGDPDAVLLVELSGTEPTKVSGALRSMAEDEEVTGHVFKVHQAWDEGDQASIWQVRKNTLGVMLGIKGDFKPLPFIEDSCVPVEHLADYVEKIRQVCKKHDRRLALYAHASVGVLHMRPLLNLKQTEDVKILQSISAEAFDLVVGYGGSWSGEHGDGLVRSYKLREFFGDEVYELFRQTKQILDPAGLMNPGKIIDSPPMTENLRISPTYQTNSPGTHYRFEEEGGLDRAIEMCTGVGQCRKTLTGVMCPSFIATRDEEHSTRGRANALRLAISGQMGSEAFTSRRLYEVLDLCLECKACKSECPSNVDMARMKTEFLSHYYARHGLPLEKRLVASTRATAEIASRFAAVVNLVAGSRLTRWLLELAAGIDRRRTPPQYARETFVAWNRKGLQRGPFNGRRVVVFADTFTNFFEPQVGRATVRLLERLGCHVQVESGGCCGRPLISAGQLDRVKRNGASLIRRLAETQDPIIVLEPSCYATLKDDYPDLLAERDLIRAVIPRILTLEEFLLQEGLLGKLAEMIKNGPRRMLFHGHCQQKTLIGAGPTLQVLASVPGCQIDEVPAGCCGMAGAFGYEKRHYALSEKIGSRHLLPAVRESSEDTQIVVSGFSCRSQISHFTEKVAVHPAEALYGTLA